MSTDGGNDILLVGLAGVSRLFEGVLGVIRGVSFWLAALLPLSYVPLLLSAPLDVAGFAKLLLVNVVALVIGHGYGRTDEVDARDRPVGRGGRDVRNEPDDRDRRDGEDVRVAD